MIVNRDGPAEGLNDRTPRAPVGGNPGRTLGAQRLSLFQRAGEIWGRYLVSDVPIRVEVDFDSSLPVNALAGAAPIGLQQNFRGAPLRDTWYPVALANSLAGSDLEPAENDITVTVAGNTPFYLGFDEAPAGQHSLLDVMLHELAHGLGFFSTVDEDTGSFFFRRPDVYSTFVFDQSLETSWPRLSSSQRRQSSVNGPFLVWNGPHTSAGAPFVLDRPLALRSRPEIGADLSFRTASFTPALPAAGLHGQLVVVDDGVGDPADACEPIRNSADLAGQIALIHRGGCHFDDKVYRAQRAGAKAVIIANNVDGLMTPAGDRVVDGIRVSLTIPAVLVSKTAGDALQYSSPGLEVRFDPGSNLTGGREGAVRLFAPSAYDAGSSVSHWTTDATPNLLMEPVINRGLDDELDLSLTLMKDLGWEVVDVPFPHLTYDLWRSATFSETYSSSTVSAPENDPDDDGLTNFEEYFFGSDPHRASGASAPVIAFDDERPVVTFTRSRLPADLIWTLEISSDLSAFHPAEEGVHYEVIAERPTGRDAEEVTLRILDPPARLFLRLRITTRTPA